jgi:hypothetical protein
VFDEIVSISEGGGIGSWATSPARKEFAAGVPVARIGKFGGAIFTDCRRYSIGNAGMD